MANQYQQSANPRRIEKAKRLTSPAKSQKNKPGPFVNGQKSNFRPRSDGYTHFTQMGGELIEDRVDSLSGVPWSSAS